MHTTHYLLAVLMSLSILSGCNSNSSEQENTSEESTEVNVYTHRHYDTDQFLFDQFTEKTGIKVNVVSASADELIKKLELEGDRSPADVLITVDAGRLHWASEKDLLQSVQSDVLDKNIPSKFRDPDGKWFGLTYRARVIVYDKDKVAPASLTTYEALTNSEWKGKILTRSSENVYNQSLLASFIAHDGKEEAKKWAEGLLNNFARSPKGNDRDQIKAVAGGQGELAIVNTYYLGKLLDSENEEEVAAGEKVAVFFPDQDGRGTHINISGAGVTKHAPNKENAIKFIEFLAEDEAQKLFAEANFEYPVKEDVAWSPLLQSWGEFKADELNLSKLGDHNRDAVIIFDEIGWK